MILALASPKVSIAQSFYPWRPWCQNLRKQLPLTSSREERLLIPIFTWAHKWVLQACRDRNKQIQYQDSLASLRNMGALQELRKKSGLLEPVNLSRISGFLFAWTTWPGHLSRTEPAILFTPTSYAVCLTNEQVNLIC